MAVVPAMTYRTVSGSVVDLVRVADVVGSVVNIVITADVVGSVVDIIFIPHQENGSHYSLYSLLQYSTDADAFFLKT